jgi:hypothetical protein
VFDGYMKKFLLKYGVFILAGIAFIWGVSTIVKNILDNSIEKTEVIVESLKEGIDGREGLIETREDRVKDQDLNIIKAGKDSERSKITYNKSRYKYQALKKPSEEELQKATSDSLEFLALPMSGKAELLSRKVYR